MTTIAITPDRALRAIQRKLEQAELTHLREYIQQQQTLIDDIKDRLEIADHNAEYWRDSWFEMTEQLAEETGSAIGMTVDGQLGLITAHPAPACAIGDKWPGTDALYAGTSLSSDNTRPVHLILWPETDRDECDHASAIAVAEAVSPDHNSHLPTRTQAIALYENLKSHFDKTWYWTATKTESGTTAFFQDFDSGDQYDVYLSAECRVRAVSEIPL